MEYKKIAKVLKKVSQLEGIVCITDFNHELGYEGKNIDNYLAVFVLAELIEKNIIELKFNEPKNDKEKERIKYLKKLLKEN